MAIPFPTDDDFKRIGPSFPYNRLTLETNDVYRFYSDDPFRQHLATGDVITWINSFNGRIYHARRSYIFMNFYFEQGIPEDIDPSHLDNEKHNIKDYFDYFADVFFYKVFSAWDTIGHIFSLVFHLNIKRVDFAEALKKLEKRNSAVYSLYAPVLTDSAYKEAKQIRHDITHNVPPGVIDYRSVQATSTTTYFGASKQIPASRILSAASSVIPLLEKTVSTLKEQPIS